ncbi:hypothetical protein [Pyrococcus kukulkanii]|uniref:Uncharacterized protein n=1 Tax=Pyrococcus kukulkanii TaxID=1609559 RepID=A0A127B9I9_9EURY|nr:hypothetical protein [Pyrococcus kukulkanii]AMM54021.1 hypothetical protein TQ32_05680 [Pyrococcus kukulkanii]
MGHYLNIEVNGNDIYIAVNFGGETIKDVIGNYEVDDSLPILNIFINDGKKRCVVSNSRVPCGSLQGSDVLFKEVMSRFKVNLHKLKLTILSPELIRIMFDQLPSNEKTAAVWYVTKINDLVYEGLEGSIKRAMRNVVSWAQDELSQIEYKNNRAYNTLEEYISKIEKEARFHDHIATVTVTEFKLSSKIYISGKRVRELNVDIKITLKSKGLLSKLLKKNKVKEKLENNLLPDLKRELKSIIEGDVDLTYTILA